MLVERVGQETALPEPRIRMETGRTVSQLRMFADIVEDGSWVDARIDPALPERQPLPRADIRSMLQPLGPVAVFGASNFPLAFSVAGGDTASALAAGCPVVVKSHSGHPGTSELVGHAVVAAARATGMPDGVFSLLFDNRRDVGIILVEHPLIQAVGFTGSCKVGRHLFDLAAKRDVPIPVYAEMGSINPIFLLPGAIKSRGTQIAEGLCQSVTMGCGQFCTKPGLVFTDGDDDFREKLGDLIAQHSEGVMLGHRITSGFRESVLHIHGDPRTRAIVDPATDLTGNTVRPCLFETDVNDLLECPALAEEMFGPATLLIRYRSMEELLRVARELPGQLTASIHGTEQELAEAGDLVSILTHRAGRLVFNQFPTGVEVGYAMVHGGPYPATTDSRGTSVGATAILRFARPVCYQNAPAAALRQLYGTRTRWVFGG